MFHRSERNGKYFRGCKSTETPTNLFFVGVSLLTHTKKRGSADTRMALHSWSAEASRFVDGRWTEGGKYHGQTQEELWEAIEANQAGRAPLWVFAYDLATCLTVAGFWEALETGRYTVGPVDKATAPHLVNGNRPFKGSLCVEASPVFASVMGSAGKVVFVDLLNYCPVGLDALAAQVGLKAIPHPPIGSTDAKHKRYCDRTKEIVSANVKRLMSKWRELDAGPWGKTVAALSLASYRRHVHKIRSADGKCPLVMARDEASELVETAAFYGGWTEPLRLGKCAGHFFKLDVSSLYPSVMRAGKFPVCRVGRHEGMSVKKLWRELCWRSASAIVDIDSPDETYPRQYRGLFTMACGKFTTTLCGEELRRAVNLGHVTKVHEAVIYKTAPIFKTWVDYWYPKKRKATSDGESGRADRAIAKMVLNSLWAKFAQRSKRWETIPGGPVRVNGYGSWVERRTTGEVTKCRAIAGVRQELIVGEPPQYYFPGLSAHITAAARERMRQLIALCPEKSVYYIGTDMLIVDDEGMAALVDAGEVANDELGKLNIQGEADSIEIISPNWYKFGKKWVRSGGWGIAEQNERGEWVYRANDRLPTILTHRPDGTIYIRERPLGTHERWAKGCVASDGWVKPYTLNLLQNRPETTDSE